MSDEVTPTPLTFEEAFGGVETRNASLEATAFTRHPELRFEEQQLANARDAEAQDDFSRGITYERSGSGDGTVTYRTPNANNVRNQTEGHLSLHGREMYMEQLETALVATTTTTPVTEGWAERLQAFLDADDEQEYLDAIQECEMEQEQDQEHNLRMQRIRDSVVGELRRAERVALARAGGGRRGGRGGDRGEGVKIIGGVVEVGVVKVAVVEVVEVVSMCDVS